jgi:hypothetical protein
MGPPLILMSVANAMSHFGLSRQRTIGRSARSALDADAAACRVRFGAILLRLHRHRQASRAPTIVEGRESQPSQASAKHRNGVVQFRVVPPSSKMRASSRASSPTHSRTPAQRSSRHEECSMPPGSSKAAGSRRQFWTFCLGVGVDCLPICALLTKYRVPYLLYTSYTLLDGAAKIPTLGNPAAAARIVVADSFQKCRSD